MQIESHFLRLCTNAVFANGIPLRHLTALDGNMKVPSSTAIFNMGAATDCPSFKLGLCKACVDGKYICYALKAEILYPHTCLPYRRRQEDFWKRITAKDFALQFILMNSTRVNPFNALRLNESGDFWTQACVDKAEAIARILKQYGITTYCYTSRSDLDFHRVRALRISGSGFKKDGITNIFKIITDKSEKPKGYGVCPMNCRTCTRCMKTRMKTCVVKH